MALTPEQTQQIALSDTQVPTTQTSSHYLVRHRDANGRSEANFQPLSIGLGTDGPAAPPPAPAWPNSDGWPLRIRRGRGLARMVFAHRLATLPIERIDWLDDQDRPPVPVPIDQQSTLAEHEFDLTESFTRYRWRLVTSGGLVYLTPWSIPARRENFAARPLTLLEP